MVNITLVALALASLPQLLCLRLPFPHSRMTPSPKPDIWVITAHSSLDAAPRRKYDELMPVDPKALRLVMRTWATGVTVVATECDGVRHGMTVSSFTSVSLDPPLVLVSLERATQTHRLLEQSGYFSVTVLSEEQQAVSGRFAGRQPDGEERFAGLETFTLVSGAPFIGGGLAYFDCRVVSTYLAGTHTVFIGAVLAVQSGDQTGAPLLYHDRDYRQLC
jgi:flavin reductase (DIM6/NTAB) family NADH-FMN oxidoreductase RutF